MTSPISYLHEFLPRIPLMVKSKCTCLSVRIKVKETFVSCEVSLTLPFTGDPATWRFICRIEFVKFKVNRKLGAVDYVTSFGSKSMHQQNIIENAWGRVKVISWSRCVIFILGIYFVLWLIFCRRITGNHGQFIHLFFYLTHLNDDHLLTCPLFKDTA